MARPRKINKTNKQEVINRDANATNRAALAVRLRAQRLTFDEIAQRAGYASPGAARNAIQRELQRTISESTDELRREELDMLNRLHAAVWPLAVPEDMQDLQVHDDDDEETKKKKRSHLFAVDRVIAISDRRSKLMGLDKPTNTNNIAANQIIIREVPAGLLPEPTA
jgi:hypothetical protein